MYSTFGEGGVENVQLLGGNFWRRSLRQPLRNRYVRSRVQKCLRGESMHLDIPAQETEILRA
jgi:hypothetical protein